MNIDRLRREVEEILERADPQIVALAEEQGRRIADVRREARILVLIDVLKRELEKPNWIRPPE